MIEQELQRRIVRELGLQPTQEQAEAIAIFARFLHSRNPQSVMVLRGCAGTGKTTLAGAIVRTLDALGQKTCLLAPTGRAAKVFSLFASSQVLTIHRKIYRQRSLDSSAPSFTLNFNKSRHTLFIIDESSMIANQGGNDIFGSGRLLNDLLQYVYQEGDGCRLLFMGDGAQLPPVGEAESPALSADALAHYGLEVFECNLSEVLRQSEGSGILYNATRVREHLADFKFTNIQLHLDGFADVQSISGNELIEALSHSYGEVGIDETIVVTRSNKRANVYNEGIRRCILDRNEDRLTGGDILMVVKNNYFWVEQDEDCPMAFIANGDRAVVCRYRNEQTLYGFTFADVTLQFPDYDNYEMTLRLLLDTLSSESPSLTHEESEALYSAVLEDYMMQPDCPKNRRKLFAQVRDDEYFNALQVKFAYAVTCHKAQGGQWSHVYIDQGYITEEMMTEDYIHWLYTAITRATDKLFLVNWPKEQIL
ncbi:MAG: AAA family ATPase [Prevotella sp.]|nr:AAA family ATPase [Prevotella sp.]